MEIYYSKRGEVKQMEKDKLEFKLTQMRNATNYLQRSLENKDTKGFRRNQLIATCDDIKEYIEEIKELTE